MITKLPSPLEERVRVRGSQEELNRDCIFIELMNEPKSSESFLKWSTHPVKRKALVSILVILFLLGILILVYLTTQSLFFTALSVVILLGSLSSFFLPTYYELDEKKIKIKYFISSREKEWSMFRSFYVDKNGLLLSPFEKPSRLENFRGIYIRFNQNKDQVVDFVKSKMQK
jgi:hypothetical protein